MTNLNYKKTAAMFGKSVARGTIGAIFGTSMIIAATGGAQAQSAYPNDTVNLVLPFSSGGAADIGARVLAQGLTEKLGKNFIVENIPGGAGNIAYSTVARSNPDGYRVLISYIANSACAHALLSDLSWTSEDLEPIAMFSATPLVFIVNDSVPAQNMNEFISHVQANPDALDYGTFGVGSFAHIVTEAVLQPSGSKMQAIPYSNVGSLITDSIAGTIKMFAAGPSTLLSQKGVKELRAIGITGPERWPDLPNVATLVEQGLPDVTLQSWYGLHVPKGTPAEVIETLNQAVKALAEDKAFVANAAKSSIPIIHRDTAEFAAQIEADTALCTDVIKSAGIVIQ